MKSGTDGQNLDWSEGLGFAERILVKGIYYCMNNASSIGRKVVIFYFSSLAAVGVMARYADYSCRMEEKINKNSTPSGIHRSMIYDAETNPDGRVAELGRECFIVKSKTLEGELNLVPCEKKKYDGGKTNEKVSGGLGIAI